MTTQAQTTINPFANWREIDRIVGIIKERDVTEQTKPKIVVMCGSSRYVDIMAVCAWLVERDEHAIVMTLHLLPCWYDNINLIPDHLAEHEGVADAMDELHLKKIDLATEVFVVNHDDYIGDSTKKEIEYTQNLGKKIRWFTHDKIGDQVRLMMDKYKS